jgi:protein-S-isoprenylcysteine O-methyltransferase Ste14
MLEQYMSGKYGDQWEAYRRATPYRLLPGIW